MIQAGYKALANRIDAAQKHNGDDRRGALSHQNRWGRQRDKHIDREPDELIRQFRQALAIATARITQLDNDVLAVHIPKLRQTLPEADEAGGINRRG